MRPALVAVSHGTADARGQAVIRRLVEAVAGRVPGLDVHQAFVDVEEPRLSTVLESLDGPVTIVPLLLGAGFHVRVDIAEAVSRRARYGLSTVVAETLGPDASLTGLLAARLAAVGLTDRDAVVLATAGSSDVRARLAADRSAAGLAARLRRPVRVGHVAGGGRPLDDALEAARAATCGGGRVVAASYLLAPGHFSARLEASSADVVTGPMADGIRVDPRLVDLVIRRYLAASHGVLARIG